MSAAFQFVKSSYSSGDGECVEVATGMPGRVAIRDSQAPDGPVLHFTHAAWDAFCADVARGRFDQAQEL